jgi:hypothetical protein
MLAVLQLMWDQHKVNVENEDKKFTTLFLDEEGVYILGYLTGKSCQEIYWVQARMSARYTELFSTYTANLHDDPVFYVDHLLKDIYCRMTSSNPQPDGLITVPPEFNLARHASDICKVMWFFGITTLPLLSTHQIAFNTLNKNDYFRAHLGR